MLALILFGHGRLLWRSFNYFMGLVFWSAAFYDSHIYTESEGDGIEGPGISFLYGASVWGRVLEASI